MHASQLGHPGHPPGDTPFATFPHFLCWEKVGIFATQMGRTCWNWSDSESNIPEGFGKNKSARFESGECGGWRKGRFPWFFGSSRYMAHPIHLKIMAHLKKAIREWSLPRSICVDLDGQQPLSCSCPVLSCVSHGAPFRSMSFPYVFLQFKLLRG